MPRTVIDEYLEKHRRDNPKPALWWALVRIIAWETAVREWAKWN